MCGVMNDVLSVVNPNILSEFDFSTVARLSGHVLHIVDREPEVVVGEGGCWVESICKILQSATTFTTRAPDPEICKRAMDLVQ